MVDEFSRGFSAIFIDNREGRAIDDILHAEGFAEGLDEGRLASPHRGIEGKDIPPGEDLLDELARYGLQRVWGG